MRKTISAVIPATLLILGGCSEMDHPDVSQESCDLCHAATLSNQAVHRKHLSGIAMENFPSRSADAGKLAQAMEDSGSLRADTSLSASGAYHENRMLGLEMPCTACHEGVSALGEKNGSLYHGNGTVDVQFDRAYLSDKYKSPDQTVYRGNSCDNISCHGAGKAGLEKVTWMGAAGVADSLNCNSCHNTVAHKPNVRCDLCHFDVTLDGRTITDFAKHADGNLDVWK